MRRNSVRLLKYIIGSTVLVVSGVFLLHFVDWMKIRPKSEPQDVPKLEYNRAVVDPTMKGVSLILL